MNDEKEKPSNDDLIISIEPVKFWKTLAVILALILLILVTWYNVTQTYNFVASPCDALEQQIIDRKDLWTRHCGLIINGSAIPGGVNPEMLSRMTNETRWD